MADRTKKQADNVPGPFYVDDQCIDCDLCRQTAPNNLGRNESEGHAYVMKQPENEEERRQCEEAQNDCPVDAIGSDGA
ncbi:MAG: ferredoxin [Candidatus Omnitrophica bacterium]|nr:ferredoxin [Candidatus Omnitrophota bacterium]